MCRYSDGLYTFWSNTTPIWPDVRCTTTTTTTTTSLQLEIMLIIIKDQNVKNTLVSIGKDSVIFTRLLSIFIFVKLPQDSHL